MTACNERYSSIVFYCKVQAGREIQSLMLSTFEFPYTDQSVWPINWPSCYMPIWLWRRHEIAFTWSELTEIERCVYVSLSYERVDIPLEKYIDTRSLSQTIYERTKIIYVCIRHRKIIRFLLFSDNSL